MKGLLLKDFYMAVRYCRAYLLAAAIFIIVSLTDGENMFFIFYPALLCGMVPVTLLAYDERSRWLQYSGTLPCTRAQIVSEKYLLGLISTGAVTLLSAGIHGIYMAKAGELAMGSLLSMAASIFAAAVIAFSLSMPFMFKLGVEKGRIAYYVVIGVFCAAMVICSKGFDGSDIPVPSGLRVGILLGGMFICAASWFISVRFYENRELE